jgi:RNA polymerase sigma-70 factor (ECF subfamily)
MVEAGSVSPPGDEAFADWYASSYQGLVAALLVVVGNREDASDCASEAFARAYERWSRVGLMASRTGWTYRVALNIGKRRLRRAALERRLFPRLLVRADVPAPEGLSADLAAALQKLTARQRAVLALRLVADLPQDEVAEILRIQPGTVAATLSQARSRLDQQLRIRDSSTAPGESHAE